MGLGFPGGSVVQNPPDNAEDLLQEEFSPWVEQIPWRGYSNPPQYSHLGNPMDRGAWWVTVHGVAKSWAQLSD